MKKFIVLLAFATITGAAFSAQAADAFNYNLRSGSKGDQVVMLQNLLISQGYLSGTSATGTFGPLTQKAVSLFQSENGIERTGFVGPLTRTKLNALIDTSNGMTFSAGCTSAKGFSMLTGKPCVATILPSVTVAPVEIAPTSASSASFLSSYQGKSSGYYSVRFEYAMNKDAFDAGSQSRLGQIALSGAANSFTASIGNLVPGATYYVRAVVEPDGKQPSTTDVVSFTSAELAPVITGTYQNQATAQSGQAYVGTNAATAITDINALLSGVVDGRGTNMTAWFQYWSGNSALSNTPQVSLGKGAGSTSYVLNNLQSSTTYSYRLIVMNAYGTVYGSTTNFKTLPAGAVY